MPRHRINDTHVNGFGGDAHTCMVLRIYTNASSSYSVKRVAV